MKYASFGECQRPAAVTVVEAKSRKVTCKGSLDMRGSSPCATARSMPKCMQQGCSKNSGRRGVQQAQAKNSGLRVKVLEVACIPVEDVCTIR